ncbi:MAG: 50S ribosomal protein L19e [Candidatus Pacearchaeota archaeon]
MKLERKKAFAARVLGVGKGRISFNINRLSDIKEALTRQDILDLLKDGAIIIKEIKGRAKVKKRKTRRRAGSKRHTEKEGKRRYISITRKLRKYASELLSQGKITKEQYNKLRQEIKSRSFRDKPHFKERVKIMASKFAGGIQR